MEEDQRTVWCGNLSDKVTEGILYELFLQGGPVQRVSIPKDKDGKQRTYGFITFKHAVSVPYVLDLFEGTALFDRTLSMKTRNNIEIPVQSHPNSGLRKQEVSQDLNNVLQLQNKMIIGNLMHGLCVGPEMLMYQSQLNPWACPENRAQQTLHPYQHCDRSREHNGYKIRNDRRERHSSHRSNDYSRNSDHRNSRRHYRK